MATDKLIPSGRGFGNWKDLRGKRFGRLLVTEYLGKSKWQTTCDCGSSAVVGTGNLSYGRTQSCGCRQRDAASTHGRYKHGLFHTWRSIKQRCFNPNHVDYRNYGARGIGMWKGWVNDLDAFAAHLGPRPTGGKHTVERIDNNGDYEPGNVRWATLVEQACNRRTNRHVFYQGQRYTISQLARKIAQECEVDPKALAAELSRAIKSNQK